MFLACWLLPLTTYSHLPALTDSEMGAAWAHQGCSEPWPGASALSRHENIPGHPYSTADHKNSQAVAQSIHQPKVCRQHFWKYTQEGGLHLLAWGWRSQGSLWPSSWQLQPRDVVGHDQRQYVPTPGSRCTVNKTVFPTEPAEQYILYSNEVIIKIGNYWNNRINSQSLKSS